MCDRNYFYTVREGRRREGENVLQVRGEMTGVGQQTRAFEALDEDINSHNTTYGQLNLVHFPLNSEVNLLYLAWRGH